MSMLQVTIVLRDIQLFFQWYYWNSGMKRTAFFYHFHSLLWDIRSKHYVTSPVYGLQRSLPILNDSVQKSGDFGPNVKRGPRIIDVMDCDIFLIVWYPNKYRAHKKRNAFLLLQRYREIRLCQEAIELKMRHTSWYTLLGGLIVEWRNVDHSTIQRQTNQRIDGLCFWVHTCAMVCIGISSLPGDLADSRIKKNFPF